MGGNGQKLDVLLGHTPSIYLNVAFRPVTKEQCQSSVRNISSLKSPNLVTASGKTLKKGKKEHLSIQLYSNV